MNSKTALTVLRLTIGFVILIEAVVFLLPSARQSFARAHMPDTLRLILGVGEIVGSVLLLLPKNANRGAWVLIIVFSLAIVTHLLHGMYNVGSLAIYTAATWAVLCSKP